MADSVRELTDDEIQACADYIIHEKSNPVLADGVVVTQGSITENSYQKLTKAVLDAQERIANEPKDPKPEFSQDVFNIQGNETKQTLFSGGVEMHDGFVYVGQFQNLQDDGNIVIQVHDLLPNVRIDKSDTVSVSLEQTVQNGPDGRLTCRIIHDGSATGYIFRKDDTDNDLTIFSIGFGHMGAPVGN